MTIGSGCIRGAAGALAAWLAAGLAFGQIGSEPDSQIESCLAEGRVIGKAETLVGVTKPERFTLECAGVERSALFKSLDVHRRGVTRLQRGGTEFNFSDSYKYERAAYLIDRKLGLNMVPVAVIRTIKGDEGAVIAWIENAGHETAIAERPSGPQMAALASQKAAMRLFDALIYNVDRRPENWMVDRQSWKLYLIDHSRAFRTETELPEAFAARRARLSRELYEALKVLDGDELAELCHDLLSRAQLQALMVRRDRIVEKIDRDVEEFGEAVVFAG